MTVQPKPTTSRILKNYNFRLLWIGQGTSLLGDQFFMIALPWLVLKLTGSSLALGTVLAMIGVPRAVFMLVGGAATDRFSPRLIMLLSDILRLLLTALLVVMLLTSGVQLWMLYVLSLLFGVISGFFIPASGAMLPLLVRPEELAVSNSIYQGTAMLSGFLGPVLAGGLITLFARPDTAAGTVELTGIAAALAFDAFTFLVSVLTLFLMHWEEIEKPRASSPANMLASIQEGVGYLWADGLLRTLFILMVAANFLFVGPVIVGIPMIADLRLAGSAAAYGTIMGAYGGGNLVGILLSSRMIQLLNRRMGTFMVAVILSFAVGLALLGVVSSTALAFIIMLVMGAGNGVLSIALITFLQQKTPKEMLGRVMSLVMLASVGLQPISQALTGAVIKLSLGGLFYGAGILMALVAVWLAIQPATHSMHQALADVITGGGIGSQ
jgi:MFS family permease